MLGISYINYYYITYAQYFPKGARSFLAGAGAVARSFYYEGAEAPIHFLARSGSAAPFRQERAHHWL